MMQLNEKKILKRGRTRNKLQYCVSVIVGWLSVILWDYRDTVDKSTKFGMKLPQGLLINVSLGAIWSCLKKGILGDFREGVSPQTCKIYISAPRRASFMISVSRIGFSRTPSSIMTVLSWSEVKVIGQGHQKVNL